LSDSAQPHVLSPQDAAEWKEPRDPQISPAGDHVAFVLADISKPDEHKRSSIWMIDLPSKAARQFTFGPREDKSPVWSPDGSTIAFVSDRDEAGKHQLFVMSLGGGEAQRMTEWKGGVSDPRWSPDGQWIAFIGTDPETEEEEQRKKDRRDEIVADENIKFGRLYVVSGGGGEAVRLTPDGNTHCAGYDWAPDSSGVGAWMVATPKADDLASGPGEIIFFPMQKSDEPRVILRHSGGLAQPIWSPDGKTIAFRSKAGRVQVDDVVWVVDAAAGTPRCLTGQYEGTADFITWAPDSREIRFVGYQNLWGVLASVSVNTQQVTSLLPPDQERDGSFGQSVSFDRDGHCFAVVRSSSNQPPNVYVGQTGASLEQYTHLNERLAAYPFVRAEAISWPSSDGMTIYGMLYRPVDFQEGKRYPLVVHIHGGPAWLWSDRFMGNWHDWAQLLTQRGYAVLTANPRGSVGRGAAFTDAEVNDLGGMELTDMMTGVDYVLGMGFVDPERLGVGGWSHGGYMTAWTVTQTDRFKCAVMGAGLSNLASDQGQNDVPRMNDDYFDQSAYDDTTPYMQRSAVTFMRNARTPTLILHGEKDERVAVPQAWEMYRGLKTVGVPTQFVTYPREPHGIAERQHQIDLLERVLGWYERYLGTGSS
jgi:dipeptidyl aminopeptidase/acylaminoacyl peptidase